MFYQGDLHSGISKAVQESKLVACFVTDESEESQLWEREFLGDSTVKDLFSDQTVLLGLAASSQEAGYLAEIVPVPKTPTLVIIKNGELKEYITAGTSKGEFLRRVSLILQPSSHDTPTPLIPSNNTANNTPISPIERPSLPQTTGAQARDATSSVELQQSIEEGSTEGIPSPKTNKKEQEVKESKSDASKTTAGQGVSAEDTTLSAKNAADTKYALLQKKRQQEAKDERARILKRVENDKTARREAEARRKANAAKAKEESETIVPSTTKPSSSKRPPDQHSECALQFRLFDGSTTRSRFSSQVSLKANVRSWINENCEADAPYTFKHVLTPLPNKDISISEEEESLQSLGLTPSATLILVPVHEYTSAYGGGNSSGFLARGASAVYGLVSSVVSPIASFLGSFFWGAPADTPQETAADDSPPATAPSARINVRTLRDQQAGQDDQQFYNGNALNFEPRKDDEDRKDV